MSTDRGTILIIDDEDGIRELLTYEFSKLGYKTISAIDGEDALVKLNAEKEILNLRRHTKVGYSSYCLPHCERGL